MEDYDHVGHRERLRERYAKDGLNGFHDYELLELLLFYVYPRRDTKALAKSVLAYFKDDLHRMLSADVKELVSAGLSLPAATLIKLMRDAFIFQHRKSIVKKDFITSSSAVFEYCKYYFKAKHIEEFKVLFLNNANTILDEETLFMGTVNESRVYIRKVIERCLFHHASQIILVHNHPSGNMKPSESDIAITAKIREALGFFEIRVLDHLIIGDDDYASFKEMGYL